MRFDIVTIFPEFFSGPLDYGIVRRARQSGLIDVRVHDLREFTHDRHRTVDDRPFGGGEGMILKPEPIFDAVESLLGQTAQHDSTPVPQASAAVVLLSASGKLFRQAVAQRFAALERVVLLCGRYEGVDERVAEHLATEELSIGDFVLSGGEIAAALVTDAVTRLLPGALGNEASSLHESFSASQVPNAGQAEPLPPPNPGASELSGSPAANGSLLLDYPHYTRPAEFRGWAVPEVLIGGNHEEIRRWRQRMALEKTRRNRPDLLCHPLSGGKPNF
jgi:tRNA (guanine37-N1)-methyltransferase